MGHNVDIIEPLELFSNKIINCLSLGAYHTIYVEENGDMYGTGKKTNKLKIINKKKIKKYKKLIKIKN